MDFLSTLALFIVILCLYIYIMNQYKKSEDLDIYEMDFSNNNHLQEVCEVRQPIIFQFQHIHPKLFSDMNPQNISKFHSYDVCVKDAHDYYIEKRAEHSHIDAVNISFNSTIKLLENDKAQHFFSEKNEEFLEESGLLRSLQSCDDFLKPNFTILSHYDIMFGSPGASTPLRYHNDFRKYLVVTSGSLTVKMTPWKSTRYLHPIKDYESYEFRSPVHPYVPKEEYAMDFEKTKFLEFSVQKGQVLFVPPYWYYSIQYNKEPGTFVCEMTYNTVMNCISNLPDLSLYFLQQQNITKKITKIHEPKQPVLEQTEKKREEDDEKQEKQHVITSKEPSIESKSQEVLPTTIVEFPDPNLMKKEAEKKSDTLDTIQDPVNIEIARKVASETVEKVVNELEKKEVVVDNI